MNEFDIEEALNEIDGGLIKASAPGKKAPVKRILRIGAAAAAAAAVLFAALWGTGLIKKARNEAPNTEAEVNMTEKAERPRAVAVSTAVRPEVPNGTALAYTKYIVELRRTKYGRGAGLEGFYNKTLREFLSGNDENTAYSPFNVYLTLAMLAETTDGNTRGQILELLGVDSIEDLRERTAALTETNYRNGGADTIISAASLWMNELFDPSSYNKKTLKKLAECYAASSYSGVMGSPEYNALMRDWVNENTNGLLSDQADALTSDPSILLRIMTTLYFKAAWIEEKVHWSESVFHSPSGDQNVNFIHGQGTDYYEGEGYTMASKELEGGNKMWFILPNEGVSIDSLLESGEPVDLILSMNGGNGFGEGEYILNVNAPFFDSESKIDLIQGLMDLGVTDCFDGSVSDFSPLTPLENIYVGKADHGVRVKMNEKGVEAAALTVIDIVYGAAPIEKPIITFTADRAFIYLIVSEDNTPLFAGTLYSAE